MSDAASVLELLADPSFTPGKKHFPELFDVLCGEDAELSLRALRALSAAQSDLAKAIDRRLPTAEPIAVSRLVLLASRAATRSPRLDAIVTEGLLHASPIVRKAAADAIGRAKLPAVDALRAAFDAETVPGVRETILGALGKVGGAAAFDVLAGAKPTTRRVAKVVERARIIARRDEQRDVPSQVDASATLDRAVVVFRCRIGLEQILREEVAGLPGFVGTHVEDAFGPGAVTTTFSGKVEQLLRVRTALGFGFPLAPLDRALGDADAVVASLSSAPSLAIVEPLTRGPLRFRIELPSGKRRALLWDVASRLEADGSILLNDPRAAVWEASLSARPDSERFEWCPRIENPRFAYRSVDVAAASHPTLAAALVRVSEPRPGDVVWDPFVGSGLELCERSLAGPSRALIGTDVDDAALERARQNLAGAGATASLFRGSAWSFLPDQPVDAIITNPPMGRRVLEGRDLAGLLANFVSRAAGLLAPKGRLVWMSPVPDATREAARAAGLRLVRSSDVDMGGFLAELQRFDLP